MVDYLEEMHSHSPYRAPPPDPIGPPFDAMVPLLATPGPPSFPDVTAPCGTPNGLLAVGGDLSPQRLLSAYRRGIFPWFSEGDPILWWSPDPRTILVPEQIRISRSLRKRLRRRLLGVTLDRAFGPVIHACSALAGRRRDLDPSPDGQGLRVATPARLGPLGGGMARGAVGGRALRGRPRKGLLRRIHVQPRGRRLQGGPGAPVRAPRRLGLWAHRLPDAHRPPDQPGRPVRSRAGSSSACSIASAPSRDRRRPGTREIFSSLRAVRALTRAPGAARTSPYEARKRGWTRASAGPVPDRRAPLLLPGWTECQNPVRGPLGTPGYHSSYQSLVDQGFRRSGSHVYRPACRGCAQCVPVRLPVSSFRPDRSQRRNWERNAPDLRLVDAPAAFNSAHFALYLRYLASRHPDGSMADDTSAESYRRFLVDPWGGETHFLELRLGDRLAGVAVTDRLVSGLSAVYTFFDPAARGARPRHPRGAGPDRGHPAAGPSLPLPRLLDRRLPKMAYKDRFAPSRSWDGRAWRRFERRPDARGPLIGPAPDPLAGPDGPGPCAILRPP